MIFLGIIRTIRLTPASNPPTVVSSMLPFVKLWIWISAFLPLTGWVLSAMGQLNRCGYAVAFIVFAIFILFRRHDLVYSQAQLSLDLRKAFCRFRRPLPFCFFALAVLVFIGGAIYPPTHYVALTYHIPRVLHWLAAGRWNWIHTPVVRMNYTGCDFEWLFAPLLLFTKSDRSIFILNFIPFLLLPGLVFSVFTRLGVHPRVARSWMWLLPTGYNFLLQAGSAGNDAVSAFYALAAFDFALRARKSRWAGSTASGSKESSLSDLQHSIVALALLTGTKPVSLPLLLPWLMVVWPLAPLVGRSWLAALPVAALAVVVSFFPIALMNQRHCGDWMGTSIEPSAVDVRNPLTGIFGNGFELLQVNLAPPIFPLAHAWDNEVARIIPHDWLAIFQGGFFTTGELPTEDWAGIGFGLTGLLVVSVIANFFTPSVRARPALRPPFSIPVLFAPWVAFLIYCSKAGMATPGRLIAPYYPLLLPGLLVGAGQAYLVRRYWWRALAGVVIFLALVVLVISPDRPLWPAQTILASLAARHPASHLISRAHEVYAIYAKRSDPLAGVRSLLPPDIKVVGFMGTADDCDISLWLPFGSRRVEHFLLNDPPERFRQEGVEYAVIGGANLEMHGVTLEDWMKKNDAELVSQTSATLKVSEGSKPWYIVRLKSPGSDDIAP
jgi:hypothetical protein